MEKLVKFKALSDKTKETEQIISDYFTGRLYFLIKKFKEREYNTLQVAKTSPVKVKTSKIADIPVELLLKNEEGSSI